MLSLRILTAVVLLPPLLAALFFLSSRWVAACVALFIAAAAWEWTALIGLKWLLSRVAYSIGVLVVGGVLVALDVPLVVFVVAALAWVVALVELVRRPQVHNGWLHTPLAGGIAGFLILVPAWLAVYSLHDGDPRRPSVLLFALSLVWVADIMAYLFGHLFGRTKLAPAISPGKTVEGVIGGLLGVGLLATVAGILVWDYRGPALLGWLALALVAALFSVLGDLLESKFKRVAGVKDSGSLLPGHGGVFDRIDAVTAALPVFALGWHLAFRPA